MDMNELNKTVVRTETQDEVCFDVRPFGDRQGEAIDSYLHERLASLGYGVATLGPKLVVLLHDSTARIPVSAYGWLDKLNASGARTELRQAK